MNRTKSSKQLILYHEPVRAKQLSLLLFMVYQEVLIESSIVSFVATQSAHIREKLLQEETIACLFL